MKKRHKWENSNTCKTCRLERIKVIGVSPLVIYKVGANWVTINPGCGLNAKERNKVIVNHYKKYTDETEYNSFVVDLNKKIIEQLKS